MPTPEAPPRAAILHYRSTEPVRGVSLIFWGILLGDGDSVAFHEMRPPGQLWQREAERDAREHGEATPTAFTEHDAGLWIRPDEARRQVDEGIERRRPAMRARRAELEAATETTHAAPLRGSAVTFCCRRTVFELPRTDRLTNDLALVNCPGLSA